MSTVLPLQKTLGQRQRAGRPGARWADVRRVGPHGVAASRSRRRPSRARRSKSGGCQALAVSIQAQPAPATADDLHSTCCRVDSQKAEYSALKASSRRSRRQLRNSASDAANNHVTTTVW